jgi:RimJ/RimL family protein N-acetyltransferase
MTVKVREAVLDDIEDLYIWRNHETTRPMLHNTEAFEWEAHSKWYSEALQNPDRCSLICYLEGSGTKIGSVSFNIQAETALISIIINPKMRGKKLSTPCLVEAMRSFRSRYSMIKVLNAEIKHANDASKKIFLTAGFRLNRIEDGICFFFLVL